MRNAVGVCKAVREDGKEVVGGRERVIENGEGLEGVGVVWGYMSSRGHQGIIVRLKGVWHN